MNTNFLLLIIVAVLLFGASAVLGFFELLFWLFVLALVIFAVIWIISQMHKAVEETISEEKETFKISKTAWFWGGNDSILGRYYLNKAKGTDTI